MGLKRIIDIVLAIILALLLWPLAIVIAVAIRIKMGSPVIFTQERPGKNGRLFRLIKFRTMRNVSDSISIKELNDHNRLTSLGRFLRRTSLDEIPEIWNIFIGEMSFVGPRPLLSKYLKLYNEEQNRRHLMKPGLTGWAQINGRNSLDWPSKLKLDVWYVNNHSIWLDIKILLITIVKVIKQEGISVSETLTAEEFRGES